MTTLQRRPAKSNVSNGWMSRLSKQFPDLVPPIIAIAIFLAIWQLFSWTPGATLPGPIRVVQETWTLIFWPFYDRGGTDKGLFWQILASLQRVAISYTLAAIVGIGLGILVGTNKIMSKALDPIFQLLRTVPPLAWVSHCFSRLAPKRTRRLIRNFHHGNLAHLNQYCCRRKANSPRLQQRCQGSSTYPQRVFL